MTFECFESIRNQKGDFELYYLVIDNGSNVDNQLKLLEKFQKFDEVSVHLIQNNCGPGPAISLGLSKIAREFEYVFMTHNDTIVLPGSLSKLLSSIIAFQDFAAIGTLQEDFFEPHEIKYSGGKFRKPGILPSHRKKIVSKAEIYEVDWLDFTSIIFNSRHLQSIGFPNKIFDFYWEDSEWSIRAKNSGFKLGVCTQAIVRHRFGATLGTNSNRRFFTKMIEHHFLVINLHGTKYDAWAALVFWNYKAAMFLFRLKFKKAFWIWISLWNCRRNLG